MGKTAAIMVLMTVMILLWTLIANFAPNCVFICGNRNGDGDISVRGGPMVQSRFSDDDENCITPSKQRGTCIDILKCNEIFNMLNMKSNLLIHKTKKRLLNQYHCGFDGSRPKVCCPISISDMETPEASTSASTSTPSVMTSTTVSSTTLVDEDIQPPPDVSRHPNLGLLPNDCGDSESNRIFAGEKPDIFDYPWMVLLTFKREMENDNNIACGGTIINKNYVMTAAHCLQPRYGTIDKVRIGEFNTATEPDCEGTSCAPPHQDFEPEEIIIHPNYQRRQSFNDIALIRINGTINIPDVGYPICLPTDSKLSLPKFVGDEMTVAGWGATEKYQISDVLLHTRLIITENSECANIYKNFSTKTRKTILPSHMCAGGIKGIDSCVGDSGGPLMRVGIVRNFPRYVQHGLVSYGPSKCGTAGVPAVYTRVAYFMDWILDQLKP